RAASTTIAAHQFDESIMSTTQAIATQSRRDPKIELLGRLLYDIDVEVRMPDGEVLSFGQAPAKFRVSINNDRALRRGFDELAIAKAYLEGDIDFEGDMLYLMETRARIMQRTPVVAKLAFLWQMLRSPTRNNRVSIAFHYNLGDDFYLSFIDTKYRF